jgi:hypothetical protein
MSESPIVYRHGPELNAREIAEKIAELSPMTPSQAREYAAGGSRLQWLCSTTAIADKVLSLLTFRRIPAPGPMRSKPEMKWTRRYESARDMMYNGGGGGATRFAASEDMDLAAAKMEKEYADYQAWRYQTGEGEGYLVEVVLSKARSSTRIP